MYLKSLLLFQIGLSKINAKNKLEKKGQTIVKVYNNFNIKSKNNLFNKS